MLFNFLIIYHIHTFLTPPFLCFSQGHSSLFFGLWPHSLCPVQKFCPSPICFHDDARTYVLKYKSGCKNPLTEIPFCLSIAFGHKCKLLSKTFVILFHQSPLTSPAPSSLILFYQNHAPYASMTKPYFIQLPHWNTLQAPFPFSFFIWLTVGQDSQAPCFPGSLPASPSAASFPSGSCDYLFCLSGHLLYCITVFCLHSHNHNQASNPSLVLLICHFIPFQFSAQHSSLLTIFLNQ